MKEGEKERAIWLKNVGSKTDRSDLANSPEKTQGFTTELLDNLMKNAADGERAHRGRKEPAMKEKTVGRRAKAIERPDIPIYGSNELPQKDLPK